MEGKKCQRAIIYFEDGTLGVVNVMNYSDIKYILDCGNSERRIEIEGILDEEMTFQLNVAKTKNEIIMMEEFHGSI